MNGIIKFYYYSTTSNVSKEMKKNNNERSENVPIILQQAEQLTIQRKAVDETVSKDPNFKIQGYFKELLTSLQLADKNKDPFVINPNEREDDYREIELTTSFENM